VCVSQTGVTGRETSITLCTQSAGYQALPSAVVPEPVRQAEDATSHICHARARVQATPVLADEQALAVVN